MLEGWICWLVWSLALSGLVRLLWVYQPQLQQWPALFSLLPGLSVLPLLPWPGLPPLLPQLGVGHELAAVLAPAQPGPAQPPALSDWQGWLLPLLYLSGLSYLVLRRCRQYRLWRQFRRLRTVCAPAMLTPLLQSDPKLLALWQAAGQPQTFYHPLQGSPFVAGVQLAGFARSQLYLPVWFSQLPLLQQQLLLRHELFHLVARHPLKLLGWQLLADVGWCNPLLRWWAGWYQQACELWVDRQVLAQQPKARSYAQILLWVSQQRPVPASTLTLAAVGQPAWLAALSKPGAGYRALQRRLAALQQPFTLRSRQQLGWLLLLLAVTLPVAALQSGLAGAAPTQWVHPVPSAQVSSAFSALSSDPLVVQLRGGKPHGGIDLVAPRGTPVRAIADGRVLVADDITLKSSLGQTVVLAHGGGYQSLFAHLDRIDVRPGQWVRAGTVLGTLGNSGKTSGAHLHLELALGDRKLNPASKFALQPSAANGQQHQLN